MKIALLSLTLLLPGFAQYGGRDGCRLVSRSGEIPYQRWHTKNLTEQEYSSLTAYSKICCGTKICRN